MHATRGGTVVVGDNGLQWVRRWGARGNSIGGSGWGSGGGGYGEVV